MTEKSTALVTGASYGIGYELAKLFAADHHALVLVARSEEKLRQVAAEMERLGAVEVIILAKDLARPDAAAEIAAALAEKQISIDVLVNNAGFGEHGLFVETDWAKEAAMVQVNIVALLQLSKLLLPGMLARQRGRILNVASTAAFQPGPLMAVYYATKAFVLSFSEALASECAGTGVTVTTLCPGPTASEFQERANIDQTRLVKLKVLKMMDAAAVARSGYKALMAGRRVVIPGVMNKTGAMSNRLVPRRWITGIIKSIHQKG